MKILKINSSVQTDKSVSKKLINDLLAKLTNEATIVVERNLTADIPLLTQEMVNAFYTPVNDLTTEQKEILKPSDELVAEVKDADVILIGVPIYNFGVPAAVKAYFDLLGRIGVTFSYTENGPVGLIKGKKVYAVITSGGTAFRSDIDFASDYIKHFFGFIGIDDVRLINATQLLFGADAVLENADREIKVLADQHLATI